MATTIEVPEGTEFIVFFKSIDDKEPTVTDKYGKPYVEDPDKVGEPLPDEYLLARCPPGCIRRPNGSCVCPRLAQSA